MYEATIYLSRNLSKDILSILQRQNYLTLFKTMEHIKCQIISSSSQENKSDNERRDDSKEQQRFEHSIPFI